MLNSDLPTLSRMWFLPDALERMGLIGSQMALRFALGNEKEVSDELFNNINAKDTDIVGFFRRLRDQPASTGLPRSPLLYDGSKVSFESNLLGCRIRLVSDNASPCVDLTESVLAALESLLATGFKDRIFPRESILTGRIRQSDFSDGLFDFTLEDRLGRPYLDIRCSDFPPHDMTVEDQEEVRKKLSEMLITILTRVFSLNRPEEMLHKLLREERSLERAINFTCGFVVQSNVLGSSPKTRIRDWNKGNGRSFQLLRTQEWDADERRTASAKSAETLSSGLDSGHEELPLNCSTSKQSSTPILSRSLSSERATGMSRAGWVPDITSTPVVWSLLYWHFSSRTRRRLNRFSRGGVER